MGKKKNKRAKKLTAMGAVVAAGMTPGVISGAPLYQPEPNASITAADIVTIDGNTFSFDELLAIQRPDFGLRYYAASSEMPQVATRYGVPRPQQNATYYGVPRPRPKPNPQLDPQPNPQPNPGPTVQVITPLTMDKIQEELIDYCALLIDADSRGIPISLDSDLTRQLELNEDELKALAAEVKEHFDVEVSYHRFKLVGQLNTLRLLSEYIYRIKTVWD